MQVSADPAALGFDPDRLTRIDKHFARAVDDGRLPGWQLAVVRHDQVAHAASYGRRDCEAGLPVEPDTMWWIASMTKPLTSVTAMSLWEEGAFDLNEPISRWLPAYADMRVWTGGTADGYETEPLREPIRVWHLLAHASGLSAGFLRTHPVNELFRRAGYEWLPRSTPLATAVDDWARLPLLFQPGTRWGYGVSTDVLGRLIEIWTGEQLGVAMASRVLNPLGMRDTVWQVDESRSERLAALYFPSLDDGRMLRHPTFDVDARREVSGHYGAGGLYGTLADYVRFVRMLARGGELDGTRVLSPSTVRLMTAQHMPDDLSKLSIDGLTEVSLPGVGFGLGFAVLTDPTASRTCASPGEYFWGGAANTAFWVDPLRDVSVVWMTHLMPASYLTIRAELRTLVYSALVD